MIERTVYLEHLRCLLGQFPVVGLLGARQVGKTTLARQLAAGWPEPVLFLDLEDPRHLARLADPMGALEGWRGLVVLDEIHRLPEVFGVLRVLADRPGTPARFLVLGSASPRLLRQSSESLAGRIHYLEMEGLGGAEVGVGELDRLWLRGGFPSSYLAKSDEESLRWRQAYARNLLERDLPTLGVGVPAATMGRFWMMLAHWHGQIWNASEFARSFGVSYSTVGRYLDALVGALVVRRLQPWWENLRKRQVKAPRIYFRDPGLLHSFLGLGDAEGLRGHPRVGASWEGFALGEVARHLGARPDECFFWRAHTGSKVDLLVVRGVERRGFEFKMSTSPRPTRGLRTAMADLGLDGLDVIHPGREAFPLGGGIRAVPLSRLAAEIAPLG